MKEDEEGNAFQNWTSTKRAQVQAVNLMYGGSDSGLSQQFQ